MKFLKLHTSESSGFTLPAVIVISIALLVMGLSALQSTYSIRTSLNDEYYNRLVGEAAEAGAIYANYCLGQNAFTQTWGPVASKPALTQKTDCLGANITNGKDSITTTSNIRSRFSVNDLEVRVTGAVIISSTGTVELLRNTGAVAQTYTKVIKQSVNWQIYKASQSSSGTARTCSIVSNELYCWGTNDYGQLGNGAGGTGTYSYTPVKVVQEAGILAGKVVDDMYAAQFHNCALATGKVYCWGFNGSGQIGDGTQINRDKPVEVGGALVGKTVTAIGGSGNTSCAIAGGKIYCWGSNGQGTAGVGNTTAAILTPTLVSTTNLGGSYVATAFSVSGSRSFNMCAIVSGKAWCWGNNEAGQVGNGVSSTTDIISPTKVIDTGVLAGKTVTSISQDGYFNGSSGAYPHVCATASGKAYCWGDNQAGQLGNNSVTSSNVPVAVNTSGVLSGKTVQDVVVGLKHSCALANSKVYCWGTNGSGQLGTNGPTADVRVPVAVLEQAGGLLGKTITAIGGGANRGCAVADFKSYCWGLNTDGQIGDGTQINRKVPTESLFLRPQAPAFIF